MPNISEETLKRLISQYGDSVLRMCCLYLKDYQLAEDITQETFLRVYRKYDLLNFPSRYFQTKPV